MTNPKPNYLQLSEFYESCFDQYGATPKGMDWPNADDLYKRFRVMLDLFAHEPAYAPVSLLDLGCGYGELVDYLPQHLSNQSITYTGADISAKMIQAARERQPGHEFVCTDVLNDTLIPPASYDYVMMNGILTEKRNLTWDEMFDFAQRIIQAAYQISRKGIAFNVMSYHVEWSNPNLFHCSYDEMTAFLTKHCSRNIVIRQDYGLYEYTVYVYKHPRHG